MKARVLTQGRGLRLLLALTLAALLLPSQLFAAPQSTHWEFGPQEFNYQPAIREQGGWSFNEWKSVGPHPTEGWKIHVSATAESAQRVAGILPKLREMQVSHKVIRSREVLGRFNAGKAGETQIGKFITIYCETPERAKAIAKMIDEFLEGRGLEGPIVPGEKPLGKSGLVYTRYGGFSKLTVTDPATGKEVKDVRGQVKPPWVEDPWEAGPWPRTPPGQPPPDQGPTSGQAGRRHPRQDLDRMKAGQTPRHRLPDYKPARLEDEAVLKLYDEIVEPKTKPLKNLQNKQWLGVVDVTPDEISKQVLKKYNYDLVVNKYPELLDVPEKRLPVLKRIVQEMVKEQVDQAHNARYRMWKGLPLNEQQFITKTRAFWDKHEAIKGPKSEALINQLVTLEMLTDIAVAWYDEGPATAAVHGGFALSSLLLFKALAASLTPGSTAALALEQVGTGITSGLSYLWPVVAVNLAYNTVYLAGNWTLDVLRYDTVEKLYANPGRYNVVLDYWTFLNSFYLGAKGLKGPASRDNLFSVFPEQDDLVLSIYAYKSWYNRESVMNLNWALQPVYGYDAWLYMEQAALKDWETGFNDFRQKVADELAIEVEGDRATLAGLDALCLALIQSGNLRDPEPRTLVAKIEFSPEQPKPGDSLTVKVTYAVFGLAGLEVEAEITQLVAGGGWKSKEDKETRRISFSPDSMVKVIARESTVTVPDKKELAGADTLQVMAEIAAGPSKNRDAYLALVPLPKEEKDEGLAADLQRIEAAIAGLVKLRAEALKARGAAKAKAEALANLVSNTIPALAGEIGQLTSEIEAASKSCGEIETAMKQAAEDADKAEKWEETLGKGLDVAAAKAAACRSEEDARKINELYEAAEKLFLGIINKQVQVTEIHARVKGIIDKAAEAKKGIEAKKQAVDKLVAGAASPDALAAEIATLTQSAQSLAADLGRRRDALVGDIARTRGKYAADANAQANFDQLEQRAHAAGRLPDEAAPAAIDQASLAAANQKLAAAKEAYAALGKKALCGDAKPPDEALSRVETAFSTAGIYMGAAQDLRGKAEACLAAAREEKGKRVTGLAVAPEAVELKIGQSRAFTASAVGADESTRDVTKEASWSGGDGSSFTAKQTGSFSISASYQGHSSAARITVTELKVTGVTLSPPKAAIKIGANAAFKATATFEDGSSRDVTAEANWSPGASFAGAQAGEFSVSAAYGGQSATAGVRVEELRVTALAISPAKKALKIDESVSFTAVATFEDGSTQNVTSEAVWAPDSSYTGTQPGAFTVAAAYKGRKASAAVTVEGRKAVDGHQPAAGGAKPPEDQAATPPAQPGGSDIGQRFGRREQDRNAGRESGGTIFGSEPGRGRTTPEDIKTQVDQGTVLMTPKPSPPKTTGTGGGSTPSPPKVTGTGGAKAPAPAPPAAPPAGGGGCGPGTSCRCAGGGAGHISCDTGRCHCGAG